MDILTVLYSLTGLITMMAFIPQLVALFRDKSAAVSLSLQTWGLFTLSNSIAFVYACFHNGDGHFMACSAIGAIGNASILITGITRRLQHVKVRG